MNELRKLLTLLESIEESTIGRVGPKVTLIDPSAPWVKRGMSTAGSMTMASNKAKKTEDPKALMDMLYKVTNKFTGGSHKPRLIYQQGTTSKRAGLVSYDPKTGQLEFKIGNPGSDRIYTTNISDVEYHGRVKSVYSPGAYYKFLVPDLDTLEPPRVMKKGTRGDASGATQAELRSKSELDRFNNPPPAVPEKPKSPWDILDKKKG